MFLLPGLFVISGVSTCGEGGGYCLLGMDCTLDEDFLPDLGPGQHCEGLRSAFTPSAHFVCCRVVSNQSTYKPPLLPTDPTTEHSTSVDVLENEIDQVLLKVAQSVDSIKSATSPNSPPDQGGGVMMGDAPVTEESDEDSIEVGHDSSEQEDDSSDEGGSEESSVEVSSPSHSTSIKVKRPGGVKDSSSEVDSSEEYAIHKIESSENFINSHSPEPPIKNTDSSLTSKLKPGSIAITKNEDTFKVQGDSGHTEGPGAFTPLGQLDTMSSKETPLQNEIMTESVSKGTVNEATNLEDKSVERKTDKPSTVTPKHDQNISENPIPTTIETTQRPLTPGMATTVKPMSSTTLRPPDANGVFKVNKTNNIATSTGVSVVSNPPGSTTDDRLVTSTSVSPTPVSPPMGEVTQGQPRPCSTNCSDEITFEFQNQPLCFGSMFIPGWVVTSASCALR